MSDHAAAHDHDHAGVLTPWPMVIAFGVMFMIPLAFTFHFVYANSFAAVLSLGLGAPMCILGVIGWVREAIGGEEMSQGLSFGAMGWFIVAEALIFLPFFATYWTMRLSASEWPPLGSVEMPMLMPAIMTVILVTSSFTIHKAEADLGAGNVASFRKWVMITILFGLTFLGMSAYEWSHLFHLGFTPDVNSFSSSFFSITGLHGSHVVVGLAIFIAMIIPAYRGTINEGYVRTASLYWHFVDIIWFFVVSQMYYW